MGTPLCMLAAVIFLGGNVCGDNATTPSLAVFNFTIPVVVRWTEAENVEEQRRDGVTPTQTKLLSTSSSSSVKEKQPDTTDVSEDRKKLKHKEKNDKHDHNTKAEKEELACPPIGLESLRVDDSQMHASSYQRTGLGPHRGRLNIQGSPGSEHAPGRMCLHADRQGAVPCGVGVADDIHNAVGESPQLRYHGTPDIGPLAVGTMVMLANMEPPAAPCGPP
ncbi:inactive carboxypeptidase-like protein X2 [Nematolebias whitei]|uniref:inactive carboxypeptidase-like protein X2 n=1 Tax=Nematolebias whitei TaxID=451745 RepID=UPI00189A5390|nr:inactive carboxypeptidase-like protein X2 [Nematolebias whitei]